MKWYRLSRKQFEFAACEPSGDALAYLGNGL